MKAWNDPGGSPRRLLSVAGAALILAGGVAVLRAFNPQPDPPKVFGILGITAADVIRLNVTNVAPDLGLIPSPCRIRFGFVNAAGAVLKSADVSVASGHSVFLTLNFFEAAGRVGYPIAAYSSQRPSGNLICPAGSLLHNRFRGGG
jgi:hypothetical protein